MSKLKALTRYLQARLDPTRNPVDHPVAPLRGRKVHVGCGTVSLAGWVNVDRAAGPGVDLVLDVTRAFPFTDATHVFAEHFLEHLTLPEALAFLADVHHALAADGLLRLSTPNLDWVWANVYGAGGPADRAQAGLWANRSFYGWGHRFLWNQVLLTRALEATGYEALHWCRYGESTEPAFQQIEQHEPYPDTADLPHVLIVEARKGRPQPHLLRAFEQFVDAEFLRHLDQG